MASAGPRRRKLVSRRRVEDDGEDEAGPDVLDNDGDSMTEGSIGSDDDDQADDSDTSNLDDASPTAPHARKSAGIRDAKLGQQGRQSKAATGRNNADANKTGPRATGDTNLMLNGLSIDDDTSRPADLDFDEAHESPAKEAAPVIVSSNSAPQAPLHERRRREHEEYRKKRDEDPAFVPNRGSFFMHDHRHAGPAGNGFRPFARGGGRGGRGRGGFGATFTPVHNHFQQPVSDPTTNAPWTHDMHEAVATQPPHRPSRTYTTEIEGPPNGSGIIPYAKPSREPIKREMSSEKTFGIATIRVAMPTINANASFTGVPLKQYTKLPDHRPPLRRDKPVRISLPDHKPPIMPRYIYPAHDRSFIFIPRALRPNAQQRVRGKGARSAFGSVGGYSRRTSVFGGSYYGGSNYSPSIALSRRSSIAHDMMNGRDLLLSPTGSAISRPPLPMENSRPIVRLPPHAQSLPPAPMAMMQQGLGMEASITDYPQPQTHPLPQKPVFQENRHTVLPMHQPRPQKAVSLENIESPMQQAIHTPQPYQGAFHQQVPPQMPNGYGQESHARHPSYPGPVSTGTPLSQIPERAIHAAPFQPTSGYPSGYYDHQYPVAPPQGPQGGYYYPPQYNAPVGPNAAAPAFIPATQPGGYAPSAHSEAGGQPGSTQGLVAQEVNGMVYYYEPSQLAPMNNYQGYPATQPYAPPVMGSMVTPSPDGFYYQQPAQGMLYYVPGYGTAAPGYATVAGYDPLEEADTVADHDPIPAYNLAPTFDGSYEMAMASRRNTSFATPNPPPETMSYYDPYFENNPWQYPGMF